MSGLSHFDETGASRMVDVGSKDVTARMARAEAFVEMQPGFVDTTPLLQRTSVSP